MIHFIHRFPILFLSLLLFLAVSKVSAQVNLTFTIEEMQAGKGRIYSVWGAQSLPCDSLQVDDAGVFRLQREKNYASGMYYFVLPDNSWFALLMDKDQNFTGKTVKGDLVNKMVIEGSEDNQLYYEGNRWEATFSAELKPLNDAITAARGTPEYDDKVKARDSHFEKKEQYIRKLKQEHPDLFFTKFKTQGQNPKLQFPKLADGSIDTTMQTWLYKGEYWKEYDFADERLVCTPIFHNKLRTWIQDLTPQMPDSVIAAVEKVMQHIKPGTEHFKYAVNTLGIMYNAKHQANNHDPNKKPLMMGAERVYIHIMEKYYTPENAPWDDRGKILNLQGELPYMKASALGATGADLTYINVNGVSESIYGLNAKATVVFLYSYSCDHCRQQTPMLVKLLEQWKDKGLQVYAICIDPDAVKWKEFIQTMGTQAFHNFQDGAFLGGNVKKYWVDITPEVYVLDASHKIVARDLRPDQLDPILSDVLND
jgi:thiol-disulfide isomerase/thioredoxin